MDTDLKSQVDALLERLSAKNHVTDVGRQSLHDWFVETLEAERRNWKGRLKDTARAADAEHRQTLAAHATIQQVVSLMVNRVPSTNAAAVTDELFADDRDDRDDLKSDRLTQLERYWTAVDRHISNLESERIGCLRVLGVSVEDPGDVGALLKDRLGDIEKEAARKALMSSLTAENGELRDRLRAVVRLERVSKENYEREVGELKKTIVTLEQHLLKQTELIERLSASAIGAGRRNQAVQTDLVRRVPVGAASSIRQVEAAAGSTATARHQQQLGFIVTHQQDQSDSPTPLEQPASGNGSSLLPLIHSQRRELTEPVTSSTPASMKPVRNGEDMYRKYGVDDGQRKSSASVPSFLPVVSVSLTQRDEVGADSSDAGTHDGIKKQAIVAHQTTAIVLPNIVLTFASKLEETKREMDACQRELVRLKATAFGMSQTDINRTSKLRVSDPRKRQRMQTLATKSVSTLHLPPFDVASTSVRSLHDNVSSRATESTWRAADIDNDAHYAMYARRPRNINAGKHWRT